MGQNELVTTVELRNGNPVSIFESGGDFDRAVRVAKVLASSSMIPDQYRGEKGIPNVLVAMELASRMDISPFMVLQNLYVIQGRPSWASSFLLALIKQSGRFEELRFELNGEGDNRGCSVWTIVRSTGERVDGPRIDMAMARAEGWLTKPGSKWKTMPDIMLQYRAASFFARLHAYDLICGLYSADEAAEIPAAPTMDASISTETLAKKLLQENLPDKEVEEKVTTLEASESVFEAEAREVVEPPPPTLQEKTDLWQGYLHLLGKKPHAMNAIKKITEGRGSNEWTANDMELLREDLQKRRNNGTEEASDNQESREKEEPADYGTSVREGFETLSPESDVNGGE